MSAFDGCLVVLIVGFNEAKRGYVCLNVHNYGRCTVAFG